MPGLEVIGGLRRPDPRSDFLTLGACRSGFCVPARPCHLDLSAPGFTMPPEPLRGPVFISHRVPCDVGHGAALSQFGPSRIEARCLARAAGEEEGEKKRGWLGVEAATGRSPLQ